MLTENKSRPVDDVPDFEGRAAARPGGAEPRRYTASAKNYWCELK